MLFTALYFSGTFGTRVLIEELPIEDIKAFDWVIVAITIWHLTIYSVLAGLGFTSFFLPSPWIEALVLLFANVSMLGIFGVFELFIIALGVAGVLEGLFEDEDEQATYISNFVIYTLNTLVTGYVQVETINGLRIWFYEKEYSMEDIWASFCEDSDDPDCKVGDETSTEASTDAA